MKDRRWLLILVLALVFPIVLQAVVIKVGSIAPSRSPWDKTLNEIALEWEKITKGEVQLKIYPGGITGNEMDMIRKMRMGLLGGAVLTNMGIIKIDHDVFLLNTPFLVNSEQEFAYVFDRLKPFFEKQIEERGFKVMLWTMAGWVHFFSKNKVLYPDDMKKEKLSFTTGEPEMEQAWKKMGFVIIPNDMKDLMMGLQSGMVTAYYLPPLVSGSGQYFALAPHMLNLRVAPLLGGLLLSDRAWKSIPEQYHQPMIDAINKASEGLLQKTIDLEQETIKTMKEHGLIIHDPPPDALEKWRAAASKGMDELVEKAFSKEIYNQALELIQEYRKKGG